MWYEILPSFVIITVALGLPANLMMPINWFFAGKCYRRKLETPEERLLYIRDRSITGNPYKLQWCIPDADDECDERNANGGDAHGAADEERQDGGADERKID